MSYIYGNGTRLTIGSDDTNVLALQGENSKPYVIKLKPGDILTFFVYFKTHIVAVSEIEYVVRLDTAEWGCNIMEIEMTTIKLTYS